MKQNVLRMDNRVEELQHDFLFPARIIFAGMEETVVLEKPADTDTGISRGSKVILFNDDYHTFDEVIQQLIKAIDCSYDQAERFANIVHTEGKCEVYHGAMEDCLHVSAVLEEIHLKTAVDFG